MFLWLLEHLLFDNNLSDCVVLQKVDDAPVMTVDCDAVHPDNLVRVTLLEFLEKTYFSDSQSPQHIHGSHI
jgi:N-acetylglutamate synthase-like GNAT family acetyltransferase